MEIDSEEKIVCTPPEITEAAKVTSMNLLPEKSLKLYESVYNTFINWRAIKKTNSFSEQCCQCVCNYTKCVDLLSVVYDIEKKKPRATELNC
ncbi:hypothetical protein NQ315_014480 [Exocentrus adspersus]|uniref:Uncharacterized protein n=1 Tax=Exocentrus adspersus TaxID=1586481 RepID=A0AAV8VFA9_9CUCU|nr:hypothetical protein NQ315_014480 [Exocentrus adspersus]